MGDPNRPNVETGKKQLSETHAEEEEMKELDAITGAMRGGRTQVRSEAGTRPQRVGPQLVRFSRMARIMICRAYELGSEQEPQDRFAGRTV